MTSFPLIDLRSALMVGILSFLRITFQMPETKDYRMCRKNHTDKGETQADIQEPSVMHGIFV